MSDSIRSFLLTLLSLAALAFITGIALSTFSFSSSPPTWFEVGSWPWIVATLTITAAWYALHRGALTCVIPTLQRWMQRLGRALAVVLVAMGLVLTTAEIAAEEAEKKRPLLDALRNLNDGLKTVTEKGNEVKDALDTGVLPIHASVQHQLYRAPFAVQRGTVYVFRAPLCEPCDEAIEYLKDERIKHRIRDVKKSTLARRHYDRMDGSGVPILLFIGRRMDGFSAADFECAKDTPKGQEADCEFQELADDELEIELEPAT